MNKGFWKNDKSESKNGPDKNNLNHIENWVTPQEARQILITNFSKYIQSSTVKKNEYITISIEKSAGYVLFESVESRYDLPPFDVSKMDGYAVIYNDISTASADKPILLESIGTIFPGDKPDKALISGQVMRIMTGAPLPFGADTVIPVEQTDGSINRPAFFSALNKGDYITLKGENIQSGSIVAEKGQMIDWGFVTLMSSCGISSVKVLKKPIVSIFTTGDELADPGDNIDNSAKIFNATLYGASALVKKYGFQIEKAQKVTDCPEHIDRAFKSALKSDILFFTGGVSRGIKDFVRQIIIDNNYEIVINAVCQKPGKPFALFKKTNPGQKGPDWVFGLPGNPVSSLLCLKRLALPAMRLMSGEKAEKVFPVIRDVHLENTIYNRGNRWSVMLLNTKYNPGKKSMHAHYIPMKNSAHIQAMALADSWLEMPPKSTLEKGSSVNVFPMND